MDGAPVSIDYERQGPQGFAGGRLYGMPLAAGMKKAGGPDPALRLPASGLRLLVGHEGHRSPALGAPETGAPNRSLVAAEAVALKVCIRSDYSW